MKLRMQLDLRTKLISDISTQQYLTALQLYRIYRCSKIQEKLEKMIFELAESLQLQPYCQFYTFIFNTKVEFQITLFPTCPIGIEVKSKRKEQCQKAIEQDDIYIDGLQNEVCCPRRHALQNQTMQVQMKVK
ncbi:Hypothetical_protein [Hexamita inflata]|uniref:Hypothetical_protein n=1 Tax=Hexamita inflata TaxID=28002 RepID=A0AA86UDZ6_9EUKA|nr:Hypothetical protein HINF_LOCUS39596 [Hexamita inflata]CAI9951954.1 Hypothetical protein HINF_LOCUS39599 [Hexamita inflata]